MTDPQESTLPQPTPSRTPRRRRPTPAAIGFAAIVLAAGGFGLYELTTSIARPTVHTGACAQSLDLAAAVDPLVHGEVAALSLASKPHPLATLAFEDAQGAKTSLAAFGGKTVLLNLWATWCVPCRTEMPGLDKLQAQLGSDRFTVLPINVDTARVERARGYFKEIGANSLPFYADNSADILQDLKGSDKIVGLPTTILIGRDGCEIATMAGPAQWDSADAKALIARLASAQI